MLELSVKVININLPKGHAILEQCRPLYEYSWFIQKIKDYITAGLERDDAITLAIKDCERANIMSEFVREHGSEAVNMLFTQFNMEDALEKDIETITKICTAVQECGDTVDIEQIYKKISY